MKAQAEAGPGSVPRSWSGLCEPNTCLQEEAAGPWDGLGWPELAGLATVEAAPRPGPCPSPPVLASGSAHGEGALRMEALATLSLNEAERTRGWRSIRRAWGADGFRAAGKASRERHSPDTSLPGTQGSLGDPYQVNTGRKGDPRRVDTGGTQRLSLPG